VRSVLGRLVAMSSLAAWLGGCGYSEVVHSWFDRSAGAEAPAGPKLAGHAYLVRGLAGDIYSLGMDQLADRISRRGVATTVYAVSEDAALTNDIIRQYKTDEHAPIFLIGHSTGGDRIIETAERLKQAGVPVVLAFGLDPTRIADDVPSNVEVFINIYQRYNPIGGGRASAGPGFRGRLINVDLREHTDIVHINLDKTQQIQDLVAAKVVALAAYMARQAKAPGARRPQRDAGLQPLVLNIIVPRDAPIELWDSAIEVKARPGETLDSIASSYGVPVWAIAQINSLKPDSAIEPGRKLIIPRSLYSDAAPPAPASPPPGAGRELVRPAAAVAPTPRERMPTAHLPAPADRTAAQNSTSFSDRFRLETAQ
jgi:LysM repeat protein